MVIITSSIAGDSQTVRPRAEPSAALRHLRQGSGLQQQQPGTTPTFEFYFILNRDLFICKAVNSVESHVFSTQTGNNFEILFLLLI